VAKLLVLDEVAGLSRKSSIDLGDQLGAIYAPSAFWISPYTSLN
jgi:hypothetical protein